MLGRWESWYRDEASQQPYGDSTTYELGARWLDGLDVEDWGCGLGWLRRFVPAAHYRGIDGSWSRYADEVVDLELYRSNVPGIFMRHVLEHNWRWERILDNALASFTRRMALVVFTPWSDETHDLAVESAIGVPDLSFRRADLVDRFAELSWTSHENVPTATQYGAEHCFCSRSVKALRRPRRSRRNRPSRQTRRPRSRTGCRGATTHRRGS